MKKDTKFSRRNINIGILKFILKLGIGILTLILRKKAEERYYSRLLCSIKFDDK